MVNHQALAGHWHEVCHKLHEKWSQLLEEDLRSFNGDFEKLIGSVQQKTGQSREVVEAFLDELGKQGLDSLETAREYVQQAGQQMAGGLREGLSEAERAVQRRPAQALAMAFGAGLLAGVGVSLALRGPARDAAMQSGRAARNELLRQVKRALADALADAGRGERGQLVSIQVMNPGPSAAEIQRSMAATRAALASDVTAVRHKAQRLADWRYQFRLHPAWFCGAAALLGFLVVPKRSPPQPPVVLGPAADGTARAWRQASAAPGGSSLIGIIVRGAGAILARQAAAFAAQQASDLLARRAARAANESDPDLASTPGGPA